MSIWMTLKWPWKVTCDLDSPSMVYICFLPPGCPNWAYFCSTMHRLGDRSHFNMNDLELTLKGHSPSMVYIFFLPPEGPNWAYFCSTVHRLRDRSHFNMHDLEVTWKVTCNLDSPSMVYICFLPPVGPNWAYFGSTMHRLQDRSHFVKVHVRPWKVTWPNLSIYVY